MAQNGPKYKKVTTPTVFELGNSSLRIILTYSGAQNSWNRFLSQTPVFGLLLLRGSSAHSIVDRPSLILSCDEKTVL